MSKDLGNVTTSNTLFDLTGIVNNVLQVLNTEVVTVNSSGATTSGNGYVNGYFGAYNLVCANLWGGTIGVPGNINVQSNVIFSGNNINISSNVTITGTLSINTFSTITVTGNSNFSFVNASVISLGNTTVNTYVSATTVIVSNNGLSTALTSNLVSSTNVSSNIVTANVVVANTVTSNALSTNTAVVNTSLGIGNTAPQTKLMVAGSQACSQTTIPTSNNININCLSGNYFKATANGSATTITFSSIPSNAMYFFILELTGGGSNTVTWANAPKWPSAVAPVLSTNTDILAFYTDGTTWRGTLNVRDSR